MPEDTFCQVRPVCIRTLSDVHAVFTGSTRVCCHIVASYFSMSANLNVASWSTNDEDAMTRCGHCDNCTRAPETVDRKDVTGEAWKILRVAEYVRRQKGRTTLNQLAELARGGGKGEFGLSGHASKAGPGKATLNVQEVCHGPIKLSKEVRVRVSLAHGMLTCCRSMLRRLLCIFT